MHSLHSLRWKPRPNFGQRSISRAFKIGVIRFEKRGGKPNGGGTLALQWTRR
jgi:hypothetical protein